MTEPSEAAKRKACELAQGQPYWKAFALHLDEVDRAIADAVEKERAKAEKLAEALDLAEDTLKRVAMHHPDTPGLHYDSERSLLDSVTGIATQPLEYIRAAFRAWEDTDADVNTA